MWAVLIALQRFIATTKANPNDLYLFPTFYAVEFFLSQRDADKPTWNLRRWTH
jgi:hypothetical protein